MLQCHSCLAACADVSSACCSSAEQVEHWQKADRAQGALRCRACRLRAAVAALRLAAEIRLLLVEQGSGLACGIGDT